MKVRIYLDVPLWATKPDDMWANTRVYNPVNSGSKRYAIDVEIPDPAQPDVEMTAEAKEVGENERD